MMISIQMDHIYIYIMKYHKSGYIGIQIYPITPKISLRTPLENSDLTIIREAMGMMEPVNKEDSIGNES